MKRSLFQGFLATGLLAAVSLASAATIQFRADLSGADEIPPTGSPGSGVGIVVYDSVAHTLTLDIDFADLFPTTATGTASGTTASHIHCCQATPFQGNAGVATTTPSFVGFPLGVTSGHASIVLDLTLPSSYNLNPGAFFQLNGGTAASAEAALIAGIEEGRSYLNIHTTRFGGGEIRGELIPEPGTIALLGFGMAAMGALARRSRSTGRQTGR